VGPGEKPAKMVVTLTTPEQSTEMEKKLRAQSAKLAATRESQLREARQRRADRMMEEKRKKNETEETSTAELTKEEREKKEKEDYQRRYKQLERNWIKFMVGMPVFLVMSYDLFQRRKLFSMGNAILVLIESSCYEKGAEGSSMEAGQAE
jgi:cation transport ATPase